MLLVSGGTGFIGRSVLRRLTEFGYPIRTLLRPSSHSPDLPHGVAVDVTLAALSDRRGVRASLIGVDTVVHLADTESYRRTSRRIAADVEGTRTIAEACVEAGVSRLIYISQLGADRASAYPAMRAKAMAEDHIRKSGVPYTIFRSAVVFGRDDNFSTSLAMLLAASPLFFPIPGDGSVLLQPLWVEDLATCLTWALDDPSTIGEVYEIGGPEFLTLRQLLQIIMQAASCPRILLSFRPPYLRAAAWLLERTFPRLPFSPHWMDYLAVNRTTDLNTLPTVFSLQPSRMEDNLTYLQEKNWGWELLARQFSRTHEADL
jgi:uncharacterized protein YbjT (DUF2867 family)